MPVSMKEAIETQASVSGMSASSFLEVLLSSQFPDELPRLVMTSIAPNGSKREIPLGALNRMQSRISTDGRETIRPTFTLSWEMREKLERAATASALDVSPYLRRLIDTAWPDGLPHFGMALFEMDPSNINGEASTMA